MQEIKCQIQVYEPWIPLPHRKQDKYIINSVLKDNKKPCKNIKSLIGTDIPTTHIPFEYKCVRRNEVGTRILHN